MKMLRTLALLAGLIATPAVAQAPQFPQTLPPNTVVGRLGVNAGPAEAIPFSKFQSGIIGNLGAGTLYGNPGGTTAQITPFTVQSLTANTLPDKAADLLPIYNHTTGALNKVAPSALLNSICSTASSFLWNSAGTWVCQSVAQVSVLLGLPVSMQLYTPGGTSNDTTGVQAAFTACATSGCTLICTTNVTYTIQTITVGSNVTVQGCNFKQYAAGAEMLSGTSVSNVNVVRNTFTGTQVTSNLAAAVNHDSPLIFVNSTRIRVVQNYITKFAWYDSSFRNSTYVTFEGNETFGVAYGTRLFCSSYVSVKSNKYIQTNFIQSSGTYTAATFAVGPMLDTDACGVSQFVTISGNIIKDYPYSQAIEMHSGKFVTITGNVINNASICISANAFASTDFIEGLAITGNNCVGAVGVTLPTDSDAGIVALGGAGLPSPTAVTISGNSVEAFGRSRPSSGLGCITIGFTISASITGNALQGCGGFGVVVQNNDRSFSIVGNSIDTVLAGSGGSQVGISIQNVGASGIVGMNSFYSMVTNIANTGASTNVKFTGWSNCLTVTTCN